MKTKTFYALLAVLLVAVAWLGLRVNAQNKALAAAKAAVPKAELAKANPPSSIPTFSTEKIAREGFFYVGGRYVGEPGKEVMHGAMYVEVMGAEADPATVSHRVFPRQRADRSRLAADARRTPGLGVLPDEQWLRRLHGGLPGARALALRSGQWTANLGIRTALELREDLDRARALGREFPADEALHAVAQRFAEERHDGRSGLR